MARAAQILLLLLIGVAAQCHAGHHYYHGKSHGRYSSGHHHRHGEEYKHSKEDGMEAGKDNNNIDRAASTEDDKPVSGVNSIHIDGKVVPLDNHDVKFDRKDIPSISANEKSPSGVEVPKPGASINEDGISPISDNNGNANSETVGSHVIEENQGSPKLDLTGDIMDADGLQQNVPKSGQTGDIIDPDLVMPEPSSERPIYLGNDIIEPMPDVNQLPNDGIPLLPNVTDGKDEDGKKNNSILIPISLPGGGHAFVLPSALGTGNMASYSIMMINGQPTLVQNQGFGGISGIDGSSGGATLPSWLNIAGLGNGGSAGINVLPNIQQPIYIGSQFPNIGGGNGGYIFQNRPTGPVAVPRPEPVPVPEPIPVPGLVDSGFTPMLPMPNQGSNFDWSSLINLLLDIDSRPRTHPHVKQPIPQPPPVQLQPTNQQYPYPYPYPYPPYYPYPYPPHYPYPLLTSDNEKNVPTEGEDLTDEKGIANPNDRPIITGDHMIPLPHPKPGLSTEHVETPVTEPQHITEPTTEPAPVMQPQRITESTAEPASVTVTERITEYTTESTSVIEPQTQRNTPESQWTPRPHPAEPDHRPKVPRPEQYEHSSEEHKYRPEENNHSSEESENSSKEHNKRPEEHEQRPEEHKHSSEEYGSSSEENDHRPKPKPEQKPQTEVPQPGVKQPEILLPQPDITEDKDQKHDEPQINIVLPKPTHIGKPRPSKSGHNSGLIDILNVLFKYPNKNSNQPKNINHLIELLLTILKPGDNNQQVLPNLDLGVEGESNLNLGDLNIGNLGELSNIGNLGGVGNLAGLGNIGNLGNLGGLGNVGGLGNLGELGNIGNLAGLGNIGSNGNLGNLGQLLLQILGEHKDSNFNVLVEPGMEENTRANLIMLLNLLKNSLGNSNQKMGYQSRNPLLYFLGHFPCDYPNIPAISGTQSNSNLWQLLAKLYGHNYELPQMALERSGALEVKPAEVVVEDQNL